MSSSNVSPELHVKVQTRPAHSIPKHGEGVAAPTKLVYLHHPGYTSNNESLLLTLPACSIDSAGNPCADSLVALHACYVIAISRPGYLTSQRERDSRKVSHRQGLLQGDYWYHLEEDDENYATLSSFREWSYRQDEMPDIWAEAVPWLGAEDDDQTDGDCCITGTDGAVQKAHLIPKTEWQWWVDNNMTQYAALSGATRAPGTIGQELMVPGNLIPLSDGLHRLWDSNFFCLFPLKNDGGAWRLHCIFLLPLQKAVREHHRRPVRGGLRYVSAACAWSRFVLSIVRNYESTFLAKRIDRYLGGTALPAKLVTGEEILRRRQDDVRNTSPKKKSRSSSLRKRGYSPSERDVAGIEDSIGSWYSQTDSAVGFSPDRGRSRTRKGAPPQACITIKKRKLSNVETPDHDRSGSLGTH